MKNTYYTLVIILLCLFSNFSKSQNCINNDFESHTPALITTSTQIAPWTVVNGVHMQVQGSNNCVMTACCPNPPGYSAIIDASPGYTDAIIGGIYPIYSVFGAAPGHTNAASMNPQLNVALTGTNVLRINNSGGSTRIERASRTLTITASSYQLDVAFMSVLGRGHDCCNAPTFIATINNFTCPLIYQNSSVVNPCTDANCGIDYYAVQTGVPATSTTTTIFSKWQIRTLDLSPYIGQTVTVNFSTCHCTSGGHNGYTYLDTRCGTGALTMNGATVALNNSTLCGTAAEATLTAPPYYCSYTWMGPAAFTSTQSSITTSVAGIYTLILSQGAPCSIVSRTMSLVFSQPSVTVSTTNSLICKGNSASITASGLSTYTWSTGSNSAGILVTPSATTIYTLSGMAANGCKASASFTQAVKICTGIDSHADNEQLKIFPNPNNGEFTVLVATGLRGQFIIENAVGQVMHSQAINTGENKIKTNDLAEGIYYYKVMNDGRQIAVGRLKFE